MGVTATRTFSALALAATAVVGTASQASAEYDDSKTVWTTDRCGSFEFVDYGEGEPGGGPDDDYMLVRDHCDDGFHVRGDVWVGWSWYGVAYQRGGPSAAPLYWDPFAEEEDELVAGSRFGFPVCLVDPTAPDPGYLGFNCTNAELTMVDG